MERRPTCSSVSESKAKNEDEIGRERQNKRREEGRKEEGKIDRRKAKTME